MGAQTFNFAHFQPKMLYFWMKLFNRLKFRGGIAPPSPAMHYATVRRVRAYSTKIYLSNSWMGTWAKAVVVIVHVVRPIWSEFFIEIASTLTCLYQTFVRLGYKKLVHIEATGHSLVSGRL